ncbi:DUF6965 family protein [Dyadobacter sandarakinus]|uniref:DUF6965 domain-containing protein n=1 Tax=Dyadobacter sandarakinus TaxID=2747268 RepID=A0ABX7I0Z8_9BACT|nr:hypothetical protein [Dyadobacter sandarakinus]QRQ99733.1 hypothetical protein HWI92_01775 [Dyadobacter sandarakinus]
MTLQELEAWFDGRQLPEGPIQVNNYTNIPDPARFVELEFGVLNMNKGNNLYDSCRLRLIEFKEWMERQEL